MKLRNVIVACAVALGSMSGAAHAAYINGSASATGALTLPEGLSNWPTSLVSLLQSFDLTGSASGSGGLDDLASITGATGTISNFGLNDNGSFSLNIGGFLFTSSAFIAGTNSPFSCSALTGTCRDSQAFSITGTVSGAGYQDTFFAAEFALTGSCVGAGAACTQAGTGSWTVSLSATGREAPPSQVPVPGTLALLGLGLVGLGAIRRKQA